MLWIKNSLHAYVRHNADQGFYVVGQEKRHQPGEAGIKLMIRVD